MSKFSNVIRTANSVPRFPFTINRQSAQSAGLVLWWPGAPQAPLRDFAGSADGTLSAGAFGIWPDGRQDVAAAGLANAVIQASVNLSAYSQITVSCWLYSTSFAQYNMLFEYGPDGATTAGGFAAYTDNGPRITCNANGFSVADILGGLAAPQRYHLAVMWNRTGGTVAYLDGVRRNSNGTNPGSGTFGNLTLNVLNRNGGSLKAAADVVDFRIYGRKLEDYEVWALYDPATRYELYQPLSRRSYFLPAVATAYTLTADVGSFALTGQAATLKADRKLTAAAGTFTLTGIDAALKAARKLVADVGAYTLTGIDAALHKGFTMAAAVGEFTLTGLDASLKAARKLTADTGAYTLTGIDAALKAARKLTADVGAYTLTGLDAILRRGYGFAAGVGSFALTGLDATLTAARKLTASAGSYILTGIAAALSVAVVRAPGVRLTLSDAPVLTMTATTSSVLTLTVSDSLAIGEVT